jgi:flagellar protein FlaJ
MHMPPAIRMIDRKILDFEILVHGSTLRPALRSAHMPITAEEYLQTTRINTSLAAGMFCILYIFFHFSGFELDLFGFSTAGPLPWIILFVLLVPGMYAMQLYYPQIIAHGRKSRIDIDLPYAISYMQALSTTMAPYDVIRKVFEEHDMFGEISNEFGIVVRDVELFGDDLNAAIKDLQRITPSGNLRNFINDLAIVIDSGGNLTTYLGVKTEYYRDQAKQEVELVLKTIEIMAEVYVTAFVAGPIALIIMIVAQGMTNSSGMEWILPTMYVCIPAGAIVMIWILSMMLPPENLEISRKATVEQTFAAGVVGTDEHLTGDTDPNDHAFYKRIESHKRKNYYLNLLRHPFHAYIRSYYYGLGAGILAAGIIVLVWFTGGFDSFFAHNQMEAVIAFAIIAFMAPLAISFEGRRWYVHNIESHLPDFLRELSDMKDIGITLHEAIYRISGAKLGVLSSELSVASRDMQSGAYVNSALVKMEERIGLVSVKRAISLLVRASEITTNLRQIFIIAITDFEYYLRLKRERANTTIIYVMIIYLSFGIYLYTAYQLSVPFLESFKGLNLNINNAGNLTDMFRIGLILATFSGIMAGQFSSNSILAGFKHSIVLLAATLALFVFMM